MRPLSVPKLMLIACAPRFVASTDRRRDGAVGQIGLLDDELAAEPGARDPDPVVRPRAGDRRDVRAVPVLVDRRRAAARIGVLVDGARSCERDLRVRRVDAGVDDPDDARPCRRRVPRVEEAGARRPPLVRQRWRRRRAATSDTRPGSSRQPRVRGRRREERQEQAERSARATHGTGNADATRVPGSSRRRRQKPSANFASSLMRSGVHGGVNVIDDSTDRRPRRARRRTPRSARRPAARSGIRAR